MLNVRVGEEADPDEALVAEVFEEREIVALLSNPEVTDDADVEDEGEWSCFDDACC